jgi:hypothetical protein
MVALVAIVALPTSAFAASYASQYPAPASTVHGNPSVVSVDLFGATSVKANSAIMTIDTIPVPATLTKSSNSGQWSSSETLVNGVWKTTWTWSATPAGPGSTKYTLACYPTLAYGAHNVTATYKNAAGVVQAPAAAWSFTTVAQPVIPPVIPPAAAAQTCRSANCHGTNFDADIAMGPICTDCHSNTAAGGLLAPHGFEMKASGHNTTLLGKVGAFSKFDGSQGITLKVEAEKSFTSMPATYFVEAGFQAATTPLAWVGSNVATGATTTMTSKWDLPTAQTFWKTGDAEAPSTAVTGLTWNSVITCGDCHTGLAPAGPQGAAATNWGLDPNYPGEYSMATLTKQVTDNFNVAGIQPLSVSGIAVRSSLTTGSVLADRTDGTQGGTAIICAKCHDLMNQVPLIAGGSITPTTPVVGSNTGHNSHHQDATDGSDQCVSCHIGVTHGWKVPRLLVNTGASEAPYLDPKATGTTRTNNAVQMYRWNGTAWVADNVNLPGRYNREGMESLSGVDNHTAIKDSTDPAVFPAAGLNTVATDDMIYWSEAGCKACNDHTGEDEIRIVDAE